MFLPSIGIAVSITSECLGVCVCLILEWIMRYKENNNHSDLYSNLYMFLYQCNLLKTFIFKIQKCFKVLIPN